MSEPLVTATVKPVCFVEMNSVLTEFYDSILDQLRRFEDLAWRGLHPIKYFSHVDPASPHVVRWYQPRKGNTHGWG